MGQQFSIFPTSVFYPPVCVIHKEFNRHALKDSIIAHENFKSTYPFCTAGNCKCKCVFDIRYGFVLVHKTPAYSFHSISILCTLV